MSLEVVLGGVGLVVTLVALASWRRAVRRNGALEEEVQNARRTIAELSIQVDALTAPPPSMDEQRGVLDRISPNGPPMPAA